MLSAVIPNQHSYPAVHLAVTAGTPEVSSFRSSRTRKESPQTTTPTADRDQPVLRMYTQLNVSKFNCDSHITMCIGL